MMTYKNSFFALATAAALVSVTGCSKQESPTQPPAESAAKRPEPVATATTKPQEVAPTPTVTTPASPAAVTTATPAATPAPSAPPAAPATATPAPAPAASAPSNPNPLQPLALAQNASNQLQSLIAVATNQISSLGTNVSALAAATTNQFQVLLDRAKTLTTNQQYQAALTTISQLYNTKLTPDQKQQVDKLQTQVQSALARTATNKLGSLASSVTNQVLGALGVTNQAALNATNQVQALLERAKGFTTNQQYQAAIATLDQLYTTKLTPEQKQKVDDLKTQIQSSIAEKAASEASSALGNFLGGKK